MWYFRYLCRALDHGLDKVIFIFAGEAGQPLDLMQNDLLQKVQPDIMRLAALAIARVVILATEKLDVVVVLVEVKIEVTAAPRAFQVSGLLLGNGSSCPADYFDQLRRRFPNTNGCSLHYHTSNGSTYSMNGRSTM